MIACSCNVLMRKEIEEAIYDLLDQDAWQLITPGRLFGAMSKRGKCCGCFPNIIEIIDQVTQRYHLEHETPADEVTPYIERIRAENKRCETSLMLARKARIRRRAA